MCRKCVGNVSKMCRKCVEHVSEMCRKCVENVSEMCRKCVGNVLNVNVNVTIIWSDKSSLLLKVLKKKTLLLGLVVSTVRISNLYC